ncbi:MAG: hypothetical protein ACK46Y_17660, partial [Fluviicola sp.]
MSETLDTNSTAPQGKGLAVTGFVLALVAIVLNNVMFGIAFVSVGLGGSAWLMYFWLVVNILSIVLSVMGMSKLKKTGGKRGLGIAGMVIGIVSTVWCIVLTLGIGAASVASDELG